MITCGVDIGARSIDVVLYNGKGIIGSKVVSSGPNPRETAMSVYDEVLKSGGVEEDALAMTIATGYGRNHFKPADNAVSEIICHAAGVSHQFPDANTVIDIGGQDSKVIHMQKGGKVKNFAMNDRCAAGTGKFIEIVAQTLGITVEESGELSLKTDENCEISSMCAVFAESEIVGLLQNDVSKETVLRGVFRSVARRTSSLMGRAVGNGPIVFTGGVAKNAGVVEALKEITKREVLIPTEPQLTGALGAAIIAARKSTQA